MTKRFTLRKPDIDDDIDCEEIADNGGWTTYGEIVDVLNEQDQQIKELRKLLDIGETNAKSILDVLNYQQSRLNETIRVLQKHYDYAENQRQKNLDDAILAQVYNVLRYTVSEIADELRIGIKK